MRLEERSKALFEDEETNRMPHLPPIKLGRKTGNEVFEAGTAIHGFHQSRYMQPQILGKAQGSGESGASKRNRIRYNRR